MLLNARLPVPICLNNVLYVPDLGHSLLSWNKLKIEFCLTAYGANTAVTTVDRIPVFIFVEIR